MSHTDTSFAAGRRALLPSALASSPRTPLIAVWSLALGTLLMVGIARLTGLGVAHEVEAPAVEVRAFRFEDRPDGSIAVLDPSGLRLVDTVLPGTNGFVRGTLRGLARERKRAGIGPEVPFRMIGRADGTLTLEDPSTGRRVELGSFGPTNAAAFARIMTRQADASARALQ